jgi:acetamidase/formamidase
MREKTMPFKKMLLCSLFLVPGPVIAQEMPLQPLSDKPGKISVAGLPEGVYYVPSTLETIKWGYLPNAATKPVLTVPSGATVVFDTVSHEGILEDQGRDPVKFFTSHGVPENMILDDARRIASSQLPHDFQKDGPHIVTGPIEIEGAEPGDVLKVDVLSVVPRVPYGVISNRHGKGALPGEFPEATSPAEDATPEFPDRYGNVSVFTPIRKQGDDWYGVIKNRDGKEIVFPAKPFMGLMGVAPATDQLVNSIPPDVFGGNIDVNEFGAGVTLYLPVFVKGAMFYTGDPHMAQGDGEVALTALEHSQRPTFKMTLLKKGDPAIPSASGTLKKLFAETDEYWIPVGLNPDLDLATQDSIREALRFLEERLGMDRAVAYAYLSAASDVQISQVVDRTKGTNILIRKSDFKAITGEDKSAKAE